MFAILSDAANAYNPDLWSHFQWVYADDALYYCQSAYDAADAETAAQTTADSDDLATGCGGFSWSTLTAQ